MGLRSVLVVIGTGTRSTRSRPGVLVAHRGAAAEFDVLPVEEDTAPKLLSDAHVQAFVKNGFVSIAIPEDELPSAHHQTIYDTANELRDSEGSVSQGDVWGAVGPLVEQVVRSPTYHGALSSLLGSDFVINATAGHMHTTDSRDQQFHKDGTPLAVRDHLPRNCICMYYPIDTVLDMGPTAIVPGSTYWSVDRTGFMQSEDRLDFALQPARNPGGLEQWSKSLNGWNALSGFGDNIEDVSVRDQRLEGAVDLLLGQDGAVAGERDAAATTDAAGQMLRQRFIEVKGGSVVIIHHDLFHRGSRRRSDDAPWRPMFKQSARRVSDPAAPSWASSEPTDDNKNPFVTDGVAPGTASVWGSVYNYMRAKGYQCMDEQVGVSRATLQAAAAVLLDGGRAEIVRMGSAYLLGNAVRQPPMRDLALEALGSALLHPTHECSRRAATYGLSVAGAGAIPLLLEALGREPHVAVTAAHALGNCAEDLNLLKALHLSNCIDPLATACENAVAEIEAYAASKSAEEIKAAAAAAPRREVYRAEVAVDFFVTDRRRVAAACCKAIGLIGARAVRLGDLDATLAAAEALLPMALLVVDPGGGFPSYMGSGTVTQNALDAVLRLCSDPKLSKPSFRPSKRSGLSALGSALDRVEALLEQQDVQSKEQVACRRALQRVLMQAEERASASL